MKDIASVIRLIEQTSSYNDKLEILKKHSDMPGLKPVLKFIYNPYCRTGISDAKLTKASKIGAQTTLNRVTCQDALSYFGAHQTGTDADLLFAREFMRWTLEEYGVDAWWLSRAIVTQDLKIGITATSLNKVYGADFIPKTGCMLGVLFDDVPPHKIKWPCIVTEKLDGIRRVLVKENGVCRFYSRSGHIDEGLVEIEAEAAHLPDNFVYDGELLATGSFKDCIAQRQATNSIANSKGNKTGLTFNIFDMIPVEDFYTGACHLHAIDRKIRLGATLMDESIQHLDERWPQLIAAYGIYKTLEHIKPVPILGLVKTVHDITPIVGTIWSKGGEGVMLNTIEGPYEIKRSKNLLKVKHTEERILTVIDMIEGTGKYEDSLGALVVDYKGTPVGVGSGFTDGQRRFLWEHPEQCIGRRIEVECFGESTNQQGNVSLNCPIFKRFAGEVE